jgi:hypothetical protein
MCGPGSAIREELTYKFTSQQCEMIGAFDDILKHGGDEMLLASRGEGKTGYARASVWKAIASGLVDFVAFISATGADANNSLATIQDMVVRSEPFLKLYPEIAIPCRAVGNTPQLAKTIRATGVQFRDGRRKFEQHSIAFSWSSEGLDFPAVPGSPSAGGMMRFRGADSPIRGLNIFGKRPKVVLMDDLDSIDTVNNLEVARKVVDRVNLDIGGLGSQTEPLARIMLATLPKSGCGVAHHFAETGHPFVVRRFKYLIEKPIRWDLWMSYVDLRQRAKAAGDKFGRKAHRLYLSNRADMDAGAVVSNGHRFKAKELPDGSQLQVSPLQNYFDEWADKGEAFCKCELDNELVENKSQIKSNLELGHVANCEGEYDRKQADPTTTMVCRGVDVRKIELHDVCIASDQFRPHRIVDYNVRSHGTSQTTVEQAEQLIYEALHNLADEWDRDRPTDCNGITHGTDMCLIDKGWIGTWREDGETKSWASQPVEQFCYDKGFRNWLPAKGAPNYQSPAPSDTCVVGDNWHMNIGPGKQRMCSEIIWDAAHWHTLVEGLFMLPEEDPDRFELFVATDGIWTNHKGLAEHIREGSHEMRDRQGRSTRTRKLFRRDHWWDAMAMSLLAKSVEEFIRMYEQEEPRPVQTISRTPSIEMPSRNRW